MDTERARDRERHRETQRDTERHRDKEKDTHIERGDIDRDTQRDGQRDGQRDRETEREKKRGNSHLYTNIPPATLSIPCSRNDVTLHITMNLGPPLPSPSATTPVNMITLVHVLFTILLPVVS